MIAPMLLIAVVWVAAAHSAELRVDAAGRITTPAPLRSPSEAEVEAAAPAPELEVSDIAAAMLRVQGAAGAANVEEPASQTGVLRPKDVMLTREDLDRELYRLGKLRVKREHHMIERNAHPTLKPLKAPPAFVNSQRKPLGLFGGGLAPARTAFVISPQRLFDEKVNALWQLGFDAQRIDPVHTTQSCIGGDSIGGDSPRTGTFLGHREAWKHVAAMGKKALILEADWSIGDLSSLNAQKLALQLHRLGDRDDDLTKVGSCGSLCNTAYFLSPWLADIMQHEDPCDGDSMKKDGTDVWVKHLCFNETQIQGHSIKCRIVKGGTLYARSQKLYGSGLIFQDREHIKGLHRGGEDGNGNAYNDTQYDTW